MNKHSPEPPDTGRPAPHPTTTWRRRSRRYLRLALDNALKGAAYASGGALVSWLIWWLQTG
ncbi:hypothetical protein [Streptomyces sp. NPDC048612]|uniref:hypothetical protein n=1 Tax=Streptomyces sp. NPDC048612 TaxID=3365579 RepID=UPI0037154595